MKVEKGGEWNLTLHGPDGTNFPNRSVFLEIVPLKKIVFEHFNPHFITTVHFEAVGDHLRAQPDRLGQSRGRESDKGDEGGGNQAHHILLGTG